MTNKKEDNGETTAPEHERSEDVLDRYEDVSDVDEELLSLAPPPPSLRLLIFVIIVLIMSGVMFAWFLPELTYLVRAFSKPVALGDAADVNAGKLKADSYVSVEGLPLIQRTLTFKEGVKWFMFSDNTRKFFPLAGQPNLYVQWAVTEEHKAYRDPETNPGILGPPSEFSGHLMRRDQLGKNFERVWLFYDCLKYHYVGRCNYCLGRNNMDECRNAFTCVENNDEERCGLILERSEGPLNAEIKELESKASTSQTQEKIKGLKEIRVALREHRVAISSVKLEEMATRTRNLQQLAASKKSPHLQALSSIRADLLKLQAEELNLRATHALRTLDTFDATQKKAVKNDLQKLNNLRTAKEEQTDILRLYRAFIQVGEEFEKLIKRTRALKKKLALLDIKSLPKFAKWDPQARDGNEILKAVGDLEEAIVAVKRSNASKTEASKTKASDAGVDAKLSDSNAKAKADTKKKTDDKRDKKAKEAVIEVSEEMLSNSDYQNLQSKFDALVKRSKNVLERLDILLIGQVPELDKWVRTPDVQGSIPEAIRDKAFIGHISKLEKLLSAVTLPSEEEETEKEAVEEKTAPLSLPKRMNQGIDLLDEQKKEIKILEKRPGIRELVIANELALFNKSIKDQMPFEQARQASTEMERLIESMTRNGLYLSKLKGAPEEMARFEKLLPPEVLNTLQKRIDTVAPDIENHDFVLIDGEIPLDKLWVLLVYAILTAMVVVNIRKLWRFWLAFKS